MPVRPLQAVEAALLRCIRSRLRTDSVQEVPVPQGLGAARINGLPRLSPLCRCGASPSPCSAAMRRQAMGTADCTTTNCWSASLGCCRMSHQRTSSATSDPSTRTEATGFPWKSSRGAGRSACWSVDRKRKAPHLRRAWSSRRADPSALQAASGDLPRSRRRGAQLYYSNDRSDDEEEEELKEQQQEEDNDIEEEREEEAAAVDGRDSARQSKDFDPFAVRWAGRGSGTGQGKGRGRGRGAWHWRGEKGSAPD